MTERRCAPLRRAMLGSVLRALAVPLALASTTARAEWMEASSTHFRIYANGSEAWLRDFATRLEQLDAAIRRVARLGDADGERSNRLTIYVTPKLTSVQVLGGADYVAGFYHASIAGSVAFTSRDKAPANLDPDVVLFHEYAHHMMFRNFAALYPAWYAEGFAELIGTATARDGSLWIGGAANHRAYSILNYSLSAERLLDPDYVRLPSIDLDLFYGRAWLLTHYLTMSSERSGQLQRYLAAVQSGTPALPAARQAFGDLAALDRDLDRYMHGKLKGLALPVAELKVGSVAIRPLSRGVNAMIWVRMRSDRSITRREATLLATDAERAADGHEADPVVQAWLARIEHDAGDLDAADRAADRALAVDPKSIQAMVYKGFVAMERLIRAHSRDPAQWIKARAWFVRANRLDTAAAEPPYRYYQSFLLAGEALTPNARSALAGAFALAPEDAAVRRDATIEMLEAGKIEAARTSLAVLASAPHSNDERARSAFALLTAGKTAEALATLRSERRIELGGRRSADPATPRALHRGKVAANRPAAT